MNKKANATLKGTRDIKNLIKFIVATLIGIIIVLIPFSFANGVDTILFHYIKAFVATFQFPITLLIALIFCISTIMAVIDQIWKPNFIRQNRTLKPLFSTTPFYTVNRILGTLITLMCLFHIGPTFLISEDTGTTMVNLAVQLSVIVPIMLLFQTFILEFGAMEFIGELIGFLIKPIFKISEICAVSAISAWVGPGNAAILASKELFEKGYYTVKETAILGSQFSTSSIGWVVLVCSVLDVVDYFGYIFLGITIIGMIVAFICVRIPPISQYPDTYVDGTIKTEESTATHHQKFKTATVMATKRASEVTASNFINKKDNMMFYVVWLMPIIVCWGTLALAISVYTPVLAWISYPIQWILQVAGIPEAATTASAIMSGFADNYLPVILGSHITETSSKVVIAMMSILQLIFLSEIATLLTSANAIKKFSHIVIIFLERTFIALPFVILFVKLLF
ncbi:YjiH family protein [Staphylococcus coagulans]|uniref:YjiH family protein n=1 Tax=Staphylococcus coagulans TaxID=74706 RepID=UPI00067C62B4|nr:arginine transporter [Staphylococcus coagulans]MBA8764431.1 arginine transporter [Staphylococcus coagulans]MBA8774902.1 arginine transporter [Staphylococcus coagulans]MBT2809892.1 arginine transporter [Staphylococcus coagulans]MBT2812844.1 arginine transporter [Staphylococcus coagulans]MBT2814531.1 arginine transporter [Staphylococcus coagulans]